MAQSPIHRGLDLLAAAYPERSLDELAKLPIGVRDGMLMALREEVFGPKLVCITNCPSCGELLELTVDVEDIRVQPSDSEAILSVSKSGIEVQFRLPNSLDLIAVTDKQDVADVSEFLIERCVVEVRQNGEILSFAQLPSNVIEAIEERMAEADPQAAVSLDLSCPACGYKWQAAFDIVHFFWNEINAWARRILQEVHFLASAYGWSEGEILAMSHLRRQVYLDLVTQ